MTKAVTGAVRKQIRELHDSGMPYTKIARLLNYHPDTVARHCNPQLEQKLRDYVRAQRALKRDDPVYLANLRKKDAIYMRKWRKKYYEERHERVIKKIAEQTTAPVSDVFKIIGAYLKEMRG